MLVPFAATVSIDGDLVILDPERGASFDLTDSEQLDLLHLHASDSHLRLRAAAFAHVVHTPSGDFVRIDVERRDDESLTVLVPYRLGRILRRTTFGVHATFARELRIWPCR